MNELEKKEERSCLLIFTTLFIGISLIIFSRYYLYGKTFIRDDGWLQHYKALVYYQSYLRQILSKIIVEHKFEIPMWDFSLGEGADILTTLHYYCIGDPFAFLVVLVPQNYIWLFYALISILKMHFAGVLVIKLCLYTGRKNKYGVVAGALIYSFCYWTLMFVVKHPFFINPMVYLPLVVLGVEHIIRDNKPLIFTFGVFISAISNVYFFYMIVVLTVVYVVIRLFIIYKKDISSIIKVIFKIGIHSIFGVLMAAVVLFPSVYVILTSNRVGTNYGLHIFYPLKYYKRLSAMFFAPIDLYETHMGFAAPVFLSTLMNFRHPRKSPTVFSLNLTALILVVFPVFGKILNGMTYVINRWTFALALVAAYSFADKWEEFEKDKKFLVIATACVLPLCFISTYKRYIKIIPSILILVFLLIVVCAEKIKLLKKDNKQILMLSVVLLGILYVANYNYSPKGENRVARVKTIEEAQAVITSTEAYKLKSNLTEEEFSRYSGNNLTFNAAPLAKTNSTDFYWSISNSNVIDYRNALGINEYQVHYYYGYNQRSPLYTLANVKKYITDKGSAETVPYGFEFDQSINDYDIYINQNSLPFGFTYSKTLSKESWNELDQIKKQEVMLQAIVLDDAKDDVLIDDTERIDYEFTDFSGITKNDNLINLEEAYASLVLELKKPAEGELYISFDGIDWNNENSYEDGATDLKISITTDSIDTSIEYHTNDFQFYTGRDNFSAYLGTEPTDRITLTFDCPGIFQFDNLYITQVSRKNYRGYTSSLSKDHLENVEFSTNKVKGEISLDKEKYLLLSIPYSEGWKAYVDGVETKLLLANDCYMALDLSAGTHTIELSYCSQFIIPCTAISILSTVAYIVLYSKYYRCK